MSTAAIDDRETTTVTVSLKHDVTASQFERNISVLVIDGSEYEINDEDLSDATVVQSIFDLHVLKMAHHASLRDGVL